MENEAPMSQESMSNSAMAVSKKRHAWGLFLVIAPLPGLFITLIMYAIVSFFALQATVFGEGAMTVFDILNAILGLLGMLCVVGLLIGTPFGIYLLIKKTVPADSDKAIK